MATLGFKHLVVVKFKEEARVDEILKGLEKLVSEIDDVKSFEWGEDIESHEMLRQGFTHAFSMTFENKEAYVSFTSHPLHVDFSAAFTAAIDKIVLLDFPVVMVKPSSS
ncbi:PREDICTED: stress-response A/B barrel domain-containing protein At5g22580-like [Tarenaya hassleriana]|uniref:stress-response A/B barrel domain-containing protein At5g22580-like n=1 Tax=Tarenaya hassleriana TaxID=28532 RepID=UPI00053CA9B6|nr:PREDICTED: stress-response A/B barrel domain-containing protein At5g22580-like [Tarenaya hassleriana]